MYPLVADLHALFAFPPLGMFDARNCADMRASFPRHRVLLYSLRTDVRTLSEIDLFADCECHTPDVVSYLSSFAVPGFKPAPLAAASLLLNGPSPRQADAVEPPDTFP